MNVLGRIMGIGVAAMLATGLVGLSNVGVRGGSTDESLLRLSWRSAGRRIEECRVPTQAELDALPRHMRPTQICEGRIEPLRLAVWIDDSLVIDRVLHAAGAREDRPIFVFEELTLPAGSHRIEVTFGAAPGARENAAPQKELDASIDAVPGRVLLVTIDGETGELVVIDRVPGASTDTD